MTKTVEELTDELHVCQRRLADISGSTLEVDRVLQHAAKDAPAWLQDRLINPDFCATRVPGSSTVPLAERDMLRTCKASSTMTAWFLLISALSMYAWRC